MSNVFILNDKNSRSIKIKNYIKNFKIYHPSKSDLIIVIGGDGFMLSALKNITNMQKPFYGINAGNYGFLMNKFHQKIL